MRFAALFLALLAGPALAEDPAFGLVARMRAQCAAWGDSLIGPEDVYTPIMQAGDGTRIEMFWQAEWGCLQTPDVFRSARGAVFILRAGGVTRVTEARDWQVVGFGGEDVMMLTRHGSACGAPGPAPCVEAITWGAGRFLSTGAP